MSGAMLRRDRPRNSFELDADASSSLNRCARAGDKPKSFKTESTTELEVVWP